MSMDRSGSGFCQLVIDSMDLGGGSSDVPPIGKGAELERLDSL